jgi:hypothetical protein
MQERRVGFKSIAETDGKTCRVHNINMSRWRPIASRSMLPPARENKLQTLLYAEYCSGEDRIFPTKLGTTLSRDKQDRGTQQGHRMQVVREGKTRLMASLHASQLGTVEFRKNSPRIPFILGEDRRRSSTR